MDLKDLYRDVIVDHNRNPRNFREMPDADRRADGFNPLCGDKLTVFVKLEGDRIADVSFHGSGARVPGASEVRQPVLAHARRGAAQPGIGLYRVIAKWRARGAPGARHRVSSGQRTCEFYA